MLFVVLANSLLIMVIVVPLGKNEAENLEKLMKKTKIILPTAKNVEATRSKLARLERDFNCMYLDNLCPNAASQSSVSHLSKSRFNNKE
jgi:hypothetical protein